jgi:putative ABC transport system permease protein
LKILVVEYLSVGVLAALTGILLSVAAAWALAVFVFKMTFVIALLPLAVALAVVPTITVITGMLLTRGLLAQPPLAVLRAEGG